MRRLDDNDLVSTFYSDIVDRISYAMVCIYSTEATNVGESNAEQADLDLSVAAGWNVLAF